MGHGRDYSKSVQRSQCADAQEFIYVAIKHILHTWKTMANSAECVGPLEDFASQNLRMQTEQDLETLLKSLHKRHLRPMDVQHESTSLSSKTTWDFVDKLEHILERCLAKDYQAAVRHIWTSR